jgi:hypothetical protein
MDIVTQRDNDARGGVYGFFGYAKKTINPTPNPFRDRQNTCFI